MAKLRKMMGDINQPEIVRLMRMIETQSRETLAKWAVDCAETRYLPIYQAYCPEDARPVAAIQAVKACLAGEIKATALKTPLSDAQQAAKETENPVAQAAMRAIATACGTVRTPTNALGFTFYGTAAKAYSEAGLEETAAVYDELATKELSELIESLEMVMIPDEKNPAKIDWNC